ncbi:MAG: segregation/condensation protein A [Bacilli bacterium]|nr:segregation/condensation protein A [Bacilli bacterium]
MDYKVTINKFEGPLDLLLHLIKQSEIDIYDISIEKITKQYLDYIRAMEELNLSIASEYLVMAAELIEMKSRLLLPPVQEDTDDNYEEDPREGLIKKLLAYKQYKEITTQFKELEEKRKQIYTKAPLNLKPDDYQSESVNLSILLDAFDKFLVRKQLDQPLSTKITKIGLTVNERINKIREILIKQKQVKFDDLFDIINKEYIIVTFLAILEMAKNQELIIKQTNNFDNIILSIKGSEINA